MKTLNWLSLQDFKSNVYGYNAQSTGWLEQEANSLLTV